MIRSVGNADIKPGTRVLVRCDLDVPLKDGKVEDTFRLDCLIPTLDLLKHRKSKTIIMGHIGRPAGKYSEDLSTHMLDEYFVEKLGEGNFELLENLRFNLEEEGNSREFAQDLAQKADIYVNESFSSCHRKHASIVRVPQMLDSFAGLRLLDELNNLKKVMDKPEKPFVAIVGGAKVESKKPLVNKFLEVADHVLVGGKIGLDWDGPSPENLHLPDDYLGSNREDIGKNTISKYKDCIAVAKTIVWSGPMGMFENENFFGGTDEIAKAVCDSEAFSLVGGGDTIAAVRKSGLLNGFSFVSTGGSAMLKFLVKGNLPGLEVLGFNG